MLSVVLVAGQAQAAAPAGKNSTKGSARTSQSVKSASKPAKIAAAGKSAASVKSKSTGQAAVASKRIDAGKASWYGPGFHGRKTANGERFNMYELTAAHRTLPLGSLVRVVNPDNGKEVVVRINDRGPFSGNRILDLSKAAASQLGIIAKGHGDVVLHALTDEPASGQGLSAPRVAAQAVDSASPAQQQQAEVLAKTRFGASSQVLGNELPPADALATASLRLNPAGEGGSSWLSMMGLAPVPGGLGFEANRATLATVPRGQSEWDSVRFAPAWQASSPGSVTTAAQLAGSVPADAAAGSTLPGTVLSASAAAAAAVLAGAGSVAPPVSQRLTVSAEQVMPVAHTPNPAASAAGQDLPLVTAEQQQP